MISRALLSFFLLFLFVLSPVLADTIYLYYLTDSSGKVITQIYGGEVINLSKIGSIQITVNYTKATSFAFTNIYASTSGSLWYTIPNYKSSFSTSTTPFSVYRSGSSSKALPIKSLYNNYWFSIYLFDTLANNLNVYERFWFYVEATSDSQCSRIQAGYGTGIICQNGGTCVGATVGNTCTCPSNFGGSDCSECATGYNGTSCTSCAQGYYGSKCTACPSCGKGTCVDGKSGTGKCVCNAGWTGSSCDTCATGYTGATCSDCASGYYGPNCTPCPSCGNNGVCSSGKNGTGACICNTGFVSTINGTCSSCASGYYGSSCTACPSCSKGMCDSGLAGSGKCICNTGWTGILCNTCASGYYGPSCTVCPNCGSNGACSQGLTGNGQCVCYAGWNGTLCNTCLSGYYGSSCTACPNCGSKGTCSQGLTGNGTCLCQSGWFSFGGGYCNACADGYFGANCTACPNCGSNGACSQGQPGDLGGSGECLCNAGWVSANGGKCNACDSGFYGPACTRCPTCGPKGTCSQGLTGNGTCLCQVGWVSANGGYCNACSPGYYGPNCTACPSCGHGTCDEGITGDTGGTGQCLCGLGWVSANGGNCNACASSFYGPSCTACPNCGHGTCDEGVAGDTGGTGQCLCQVGWVSANGGNCNACASGFYGPNCTACPNCGHGICDEGIAGDTGGTGQCLCQPGWISNNGENCNDCDSGYYGPSCTACPTCPAHSFCNEGKANNGSCLCESGHRNSQTGICDACLVNLAGPECSECASGYYGPSCTACPTCPAHSFCNDGRPNNGSCLCEFGWRNSNGGICDICLEGFDLSTSCTECLPGHFGPLCQPCQDCLQGECISGTASDGRCNCTFPFILASNGLCDACAPGYYGEACSACPSCGPNGWCDEGVDGDKGGTGQCLCSPGWRSLGGACNVCKAGYYGPTCSRCPNCGAGGSCSDGLTGDGTCQCRVGWTSASGGHCNVCAHGFMGSDCTECRDGIYPDCFVAIPCPSNCSSHGICNFRTGTCTCDEGFVTETCGSCVLESDAYPSCTRGILCPANCSNHGLCDTNYGACHCATGFEGTTCSQCSPGYKNYPECYPIQTCPNDCSGHGSCSDRTGQCTCELHYDGPACDQCVLGYSGPEEGCWEILECPGPQCSGHGSCNPKNGTCTCDPNFIGLACDSRLFCYANPCLNGATCSESPDYDHAICSCPPSYIGDFCQFLNLPPTIASVNPLVTLSSGGNLTVVGSNIQAPLTVRMTYGVTLLGEVTISQAQNSPASFTFTTPSTIATGFVVLTFTNPSGRAADFHGLFLTQACPNEGQFLYNGNCTVCPENGICPGGDRVVPIPGCWSPDMQTPPMECPPPSSRCLGGAESACAEGYYGELCAFCSEGYLANEATGACEACPNGRCPELRGLTPSLYFFLGCIALLALSGMGWLVFSFYKKNQERLQKKGMPKSLGKRIKSLAKGKKNGKDAITEHEISYSTAPQPPGEDEPQTSQDSADPEDEDPFDNGGYLPIRTPLFDAEAVCLDRALKTIPRRETLYNQIIRTTKSELAFARIAQQLTKKILRDHEDEIFSNAKGEFVDTPNPQQIQTFIDEYIEEIGWRVVGSLNAVAKKAGKPFSQRQGIDLPFAVQVSEDRGSKPAMENRWFVQLYTNELLGLGPKPIISIIGIYDGFGGSEAAEYASKYLHVNILRNDNFRNNPYLAICEAHLQTNADFNQQVHAERLPDVVGCTSIFALISGNELWLSSMGDCQAVLVRNNGQAIPLCEPHTPDNDSERQRIEELGGSFAEKGGQLRLGGIYPITRAFGCARMRKYMTSEPEVVAIDLHGGEKYLVLANGPFWNFVSGSALSGFLSQFKGGQSSGIADALVQYCRSLGCVDNLTLSVLLFSQ